MKDIIQIEYEKLKKFEHKIDGNVKIGGYDMDKICPVSEGKCYKVTLEDSDLDRVYLLRDPTFTNLTKNRDYRFSDLQDVAREEARVKHLLEKNIDLSVNSDWAPVFVCPDIGNGALIAIDGNHRLMAHFLLRGSIANLMAYVYVHENILQWGFIPKAARASM
jgi:hypothetical protein